MAWAPRGGDAEAWWAMWLLLVTFWMDAGIRLMVDSIRLAPAFGNFCDLYFWSCCTIRDQMASLPERDRI
jgi:predicted amino acid dehydrogenase